MHVLGVPDVGERPVQTDLVAGERVEPVDFVQLVLLRLQVRRQDEALTALTRSWRRKHEFSSNTWHEK